MKIGYACKLLRPFSTLEPLLLLLRSLEVPVYSDVAMEYVGW